MGNWVSLEQEGNPEHDGTYWIFVKDADAVLIGYFENGGWDNYAQDRITHYAHYNTDKPEPPTSKVLPFGDIFVLNLLRRTDRMRLFDTEAKRIGIEYERLNAMEANDGAMGCRLSHIMACRLAKYKNLDSYLIFEDDAVMHDNFIELFTKHYSEVPAECDILLLGGNHSGGYVKQTDNIIRCEGSYTTHAMVVYKKFYDKFIETLENTNLPCDVALAALHKKHHVYAFRPSICWQRDGYSDIMGQDVKYDHLR